MDRATRKAPCQRLGGLGLSADAHSTNELVLAVLDRCSKNAAFAVAATSRHFRAIARKHERCIFTVQLMVLHGQIHASAPFMMRIEELTAAQLPFSVTLVVFNAIDDYEWVVLQPALEDVVPVLRDALEKGFVRRICIHIGPERTAQLVNSALQYPAPKLTEITLFIGDEENIRIFPLPLNFLGGHAPRLKTCSFTAFQ